MFTGIVEEVGLVARWSRTGQGVYLTIEAGSVLSDIRLGDSIAVNGVCLTVVDFDANTFTVNLAPETLARTNLKRLRKGEPLNLERALTPATRLGGHFVQGHVDGVGVITHIRPDADALWLTVATPPKLMRYIVPKGFVALDGISLTVVDVFENSFTVTLVAYTQKHVALARQSIGYHVNIEVDILGKYVERIMTTQSLRTEGVSFDFLAEHGYK
ncbi:MAG: riboflavin synthase [Chloroflexi bacterium]|nr:riboflavin synthase [Chloroflexota bacterium]